MGWRTKRSSSMARNSMSETNQPRFAASNSPAMRATAVAFLIFTACFSGYEGDAQSSLRVRRGDLVTDLVLTGELEPARGDELTVPPLPSWQTSIKWIAEDGAELRKGEPVVELDSASLNSELDQKRN